MAELLSDVLWNLSSRKRSDLVLLWLLLLLFDFNALRSWRRVLYTMKSCRFILKIPMPFVPLRDWE